MEWFPILLVSAIGSVVVFFWSAFLLRWARGDLSPSTEGAACPRCGAHELGDTVSRIDDDNATRDLILLMLARAVAMLFIIFGGFHILRDTKFDTMLHRLSP